MSNTLVSLSEKVMQRQSFWL